jgi:hypothetical protein
MLIEQAKTPRSSLITPKINWYTIPFYLISLCIEPINKLSVDILSICNNNANYLIPVIGMNYIVFTSFNRDTNEETNEENNEESDTENENNLYNQENIDYIDIPRRFNVPSPYTNQESNLTSNNLNKRVKGFFY